jgi:hypothetical protein
MAGYESTLTLSVSNLKQGDTSPVLVLTFEDNTEGTMGPTDLTGATSIKFVMKGKNGGTITPTAGGTCPILEAAHGTASYVWQAGDLATPDVYSVEAVIVDPTGTRTVPSMASNNPTLTIDAQLDPGAGL